MKKRMGRIAGALLLALMAASSLSVGESGLPPSAAEPATSQRLRKPNILLVLTDDQRANTLWAMPKIRRKIVKKGVKFEQGYVSNSLCCPSRATILTGRYSHGHGVYTNHAPLGGFSVFDDSSTIATWLDNAGYRTALMGKYLNQYSDPSYMPPGLG